MAQKRGKAKSEFTQGKKGSGTFVKLSETTARIDFDDEEKIYPLTLVVDGDDKNFPDHFKFVKMPINHKTQVDVTLTENNDGIMYISPWNFEGKAKFSNFSGFDEDTPPAPKQPKEKNKWGNDKKPTCWATIEITKGKWAGCKKSVYLQYLFSTDEDGDIFIPTSDMGDKLADFMDAIGVETSDLTKSENLLPQIQKLAQERADENEFDILIEKGWVNRTHKPFVEEEWEDVPDNTNPEDETIGFTENQKEAVTIHPALKEEG